MLDVLPVWFLTIIAGLLGAILGSFANVCIWRMPRDESIVRPPSHCPRCGHRLAWWENVPVLSYLFLRGRCRTCRERISVRYPLVELFTILLSLLVWWWTGDPIDYLLYFCLLFVPLVIVTVIDLEHRIIPDEISLPGIPVGIAVHTITHASMGYGWAALDGLLGALVGGGVLFLVAFAYEKLKKQEGLGGGDIKLIAMLGAFLGWRAAILTLFAASLLGSIVGLILVLILRKGMKYAIPFGPFLVAGGMLYFFFGNNFLRWYAGFLR